MTVRWALADSKITCLDCLAVFLDVSELDLTITDCNLAWIAHSGSDCHPIFGDTDA